MLFTMLQAKFHRVRLTSGAPFTALTVTKSIDSLRLEPCAADNNRVASVRAARCHL
jgi:hypothetical protein